MRLPGLEVVAMLAQNFQQQSALRFTPSCSSVRLFQIVGSPKEPFVLILQDLEDAPEDKPGNLRDLRNAQSHHG